MANTVQSRAKTYYPFVAEPQRLTNENAGQLFVRSQPLNRSWLYIPLGTTDEAIRAVAGKLISVDTNAFSMGIPIAKDDYIELRFSPELNDGYWVSVQKCIEIFAKNPPQPVEVTVEQK